MPSALFSFLPCSVWPWVVPLTTLAGQGISRELRNQTWDLLLLTPSTPDDVLLARAAGSVRTVWSLAAGSAVLAALLIAGIAIPAIALTSSGLTPWTFLLVALAALVFVAERVQEFALALLIGIHSGRAAGRARLTFWLGLAGGLLMRLVPAVLTLLLASELLFGAPALFGIRPR